MTPHDPNTIQLLDPVFAEAVALLDRGDVAALEPLLAEHPRLVAERAPCGEGYFHRPYLLWFVAQNPVRGDRVPTSAPDVVRAIVAAARRTGVPTLREQLDGTLALVASGRVAREWGQQVPLIDMLVDEGADPAAGLRSALAHRERAAAARLLERGAPLTLLAAACLGRPEDVARLVTGALQAERLEALVGASIHGRAEAVRILTAAGVDPNAFGAEGFHAHATALHQAVDGGSLDTVRALVEAGADPRIRDRAFRGNALDWAVYFHRDDIARYLREARNPPGGGGTERPQDGAAVLAAVPCLSVRDVAASADWYREVLGFTGGFWGPPDAPVFAILARNGVEIMLSRGQPGGPAPGAGMSAYVRVEDVDALHRRVVAHLPGVGPPESREYGCREIEVRDPDGHVLVCGEC